MTALWATIKCPNLLYRKVFSSEDGTLCMYAQCVHCLVHLIELVVRPIYWTYSTKCIDDIINHEFRLFVCVCQYGFYFFHIWRRSTQEATPMGVSHSTSRHKCYYYILPLLWYIMPHYERLRTVRLTKWLSQNLSLQWS